MTNPDGSSMCAGRYRVFGHTPVVEMHTSAVSVMPLFRMQFVLPSPLVVVASWRTLYAELFELLFRPVAGVVLESEKKTRRTRY